MRVRHRQVLAALVAVAAVLRFSTLDAQSFWFDEATTVGLVRMDLVGMLKEIPSSESSPPLYYVLAWFWAKLLGTGEAGIRSLSALLGTASVAVFYAAGAELVSRRTGLFVAAIAAVNPLLIWYSQEARAYGLLMLLGGLSLWLFARFLVDQRQSTLAWWALASALALCTHYFAAFVVAPQAAWLLSAARRQPAVIAAVAAVSAVALALLPLALHQESLQLASFVSAVGGSVRVAQIPKQFLVGFDAPIEEVLTATALAAVAVSVWLLIRRAGDREQRGASIAILIAAASVAAPVAVALVGFDYLDTRNVITAWLPATIALAAGLSAPAAGRAGLAGAGALCLAGLIAVIAVPSDPQYQRDDWRGAAEAIGQPSGARAIVVTPANGERPLRLYTGAEPLTGLPQVQEVVVLGMARRTHDRTATPPRPMQPPQAYPGFTLAERTLGETFTIYRFTAPSPQPADQNVLALSRIGNSGSASVLLQLP